MIDSNPFGGNNMDIYSDNGSLHTAQDDGEDIAIGEVEENQQKDIRSRTQKRIKVRIIIKNKRQGI